MYPVVGDVAEEETQRKEGLIGERLRGSGQTPQCGEILNLSNLDLYLSNFVGQFQKYFVLHILHRAYGGSKW